MLNWNTPRAYDSPGAPPNGSGYVRLRSTTNGSAYLGADDLKSLSFKGATTLAPQDVEWTVAGTPPSTTTPDTECGAIPSGAAPAALHSGCGEDMDRSIVREVTVPTANATLSFDALWDIEEGWDFAFVQISDDDGATWKTLATNDTTTEADPGASSTIVSNLPGLTGDSGSWQTQTADLSAYAGKKVQIGFRYMTDPAANEGGIWIRNAKVGDTVLPTGSLDGWKTLSQVNPPKVAGFTV